MSTFDDSNISTNNRLDTTSINHVVDFIHYPIIKNEIINIKPYQIFDYLPIKKELLSNIEIIETNIKGDTVFFSCDDKTIRMWNIKTTSFIIISGIKDKIRSLFILPSEDSILICDENNVYIYKIDEKKIIDNAVSIRYLKDKRISFFSLSKDKKKLYAISDLNIIYQWNLDNKRSFDFEKIDNTYEIMLSDNSKLIYNTLIKMQCINDGIYIITSNNGIYSCNIASENGYLEFNKIISRFSNKNILSASYDDKTNILHVLDDKFYINNINLDNYNIKSYEIRGYLPAVQVKLSNKGRYVSVIDNQGVLNFWNGDKGIVENIRVGGTFNLNVLGFNNNDDGIFASDSNGNILYISLISANNNSNSINGVFVNFKHSLIDYYVISYIINLNIIIFILTFSTLLFIRRYLIHFNI